MQEHNRRIAKNTLYLYVRTLITTLIGIFSGRVCLEALGIDNYGIQNVVAGIIGFSGLITNTLSNAGSRFILVTIGKGDIQYTRNVFSTVLGINTLLAIVVAIFLEIGGLIFLNHFASIPLGRVYAANWVFQCAVLMLCIKIANSPFGSAIYAHEKFSFQAWMGIISTCLYLVVLYLLLLYRGDRLILLSSITVGISLLELLVTIIYSKSHFSEVNFSRRINKNLFHTVLIFSGWNLMGNTAYVFNNQGVSLLINSFFGVVANAAKGVATTVTSCIVSFVSSFTITYKPQLTKLYANGAYDECYTLANRGQRITWYLIFLFIVPAFFEANMLLHIWLKEVPPMAVIFLRLALIEIFAVVNGDILYDIIQAQGNLKRYNIEVSLYGGLVFPAIWIAFHFGAPVWASYPIYIYIYLTLTGIRLHCISRLTTYKWQSFFKEVVSPGMKVLSLSIIVPSLISLTLPDNLLRFFVLVPATFVSMCVIILWVGFNKGERLTIIQIIKSKIGVWRKQYGQTA